LCGVHKRSKHPKFVCTLLARHVRHREREYWTSRLPHSRAPRIVLCAE
jgi:hypothetical protein